MARKKEPEIITLTPKQCLLTDDQKLLLIESVSTSLYAGKLSHLVANTLDKLHGEKTIEPE